MKRILFVGHDASLTGAPMVLLHFLRWLKSNRPDWHYDILLLGGGPLESEYGELGTVVVIQPFDQKYLFGSLEKRVRRKFGFPKRLLRKDIPKELASTYDLVMGNTMVTLPVLEFFWRSGSRTVAWLHEMERLILDHYAPRAFRNLCNSVDELILASKKAATVVDRFSIKTPYTIVYDFSAMPKLEGAKALDRDIPDNAFVILGCGTVEPRKGAHLFVEIANGLTKQYSDIYFVWVGGWRSGSDDYGAEIRSSIAKNDNIIFIGQKQNLAQYFQRADVFALTSLEDPFPLVCLEAASFGKPIICFEDAGGMPEFVADDCGFVVPYENVDEFAEKVIRFHDQPELRSRLGENAALKVNERHSLNRSCGQIAAVIEKLLVESPAT